MVCWKAMTPVRPGKTAIGNGAHGINSFLLKSYRFFEYAFGSVRWWWGICLTCAAILAWSTRHTMNPDGLSYLDMASEALDGGPSKLVNGYWSPGYPGMIAGAMWLFRPSSSQEFPLIHFVNFLIFILTLWAFSVFLRYWLQSADAAEVTTHACQLVCHAICLFHILVVHRQLHRRGVCHPRPWSGGIGFSGCRHRLPPFSPGFWLEALCCPGLCARRRLLLQSRHAPSRPGISDHLIRVIAGPRAASVDGSSFCRFACSLWSQRRYSRR